MLKEIKNSILFHQARHKVKIGLPVLDTILPRIVGTGQETLEVTEAGIAEYLLDDVGNLHVLENSAVRIAREKPEPGHDFHLIMGEANVGTALGEAADEPIEVALALIGEGDADGDVLTDDVIERDGVVVGKQVQ